MSNNGYFHWALQSAKGTGNTADGQTIYCTSTDFNVTDMAAVRAPTIGGGAFPTGAYKSGTGGGGTINLEVTGDHIGYLLYFLGGAVAVTDDTPVVGVDTYTFEMATNEFALPWVTVIEDKDAAIKTQLVDANVVGMRLVFAAAGPLTAQFAAVGITPSFATDPTAPTDDDGPILVCSISDALFELDDVAEDASQVIVDFTNNVPGLAEELKIGSPYRRNITTFGRTCGITLRKWTDADHWKDLYFGGSTTWGAAPYQAKVEAKAATGGYITGTTPWTLLFLANEVSFTGCRAPNVAQRLLLMETTGQVTFDGTNDAFNIVTEATADIDYTAVPS